MPDIKYDSIGPLKILHLYSKKAGLNAVVVVDNIALGPSIGGVRVSESITLDEVTRLARTMSLKNSIAGLPHGGGKAGIIADPKNPDLEKIFRTFARLIKDLHEYIPGPDMGSNENSMSWIYDEIGRAVGLPENMGGIPLDRLGSTGYGLAESAEIASEYAKINLNGARVAIHGFGSVGRAAARFMSEKGACVIAVSDTGGTLYNPEGIDLRELISIKDSGQSVSDSSQGKKMKSEEIFYLDSEILIPAATPDVITVENAYKIKAGLILQGANIPVTEDADQILYRRGIISVPDFIANAGGVITAAMEYQKKTAKEAFDEISAKIRTNTRLVLEKSKNENITPKEAAVKIATERITEAINRMED